MKASTLLLAIAACVIFYSCRTQKKPATYSDYDRGYYLLFNEQYDSAFRMFERYVSHPDDSFKKGKAYRFMGEMLWQIDDLFTAEENLLNAVHVLEPINLKDLLQNVDIPERTTHMQDSLDSSFRTEIGATYNIAGNLYADLKQYDTAINYYNKAIDVLHGLSYVAEPLNGKATLLQEIGNFDGAIALYDSIASLNPEDILILARVTDNKAKTKWRKDSSYYALSEFWSALNVRLGENDTSGLNASYAHLADYYTKINPDSAWIYAHKRLTQAKNNKRGKDIVDGTDKLYWVSDNILDKDHWHQEYKKKNDSLQHYQDTVRSRFANIKYDFRQTQAKNEELQQYISGQQILMYAGAALAVVIIALLSFWFGKRSKRVKEAAASNIRESKLKTSQKIHDVVANGLYRIINELEHGKGIGKEELLNKIESLYEQSRDISYEESYTGSGTGYDTEVHDLLTSFSNEHTKVIVVGNQPAFWNKVPAMHKVELQLVLNEIMVNMKKHSKAKNIGIVFRQDEHKGFISYKDDGTGFPPGFEYGNGLKNTVSRIKSMNGEIIFGKSEKDGASIAISFPLQSS